MADFDGQEIQLKVGLKPGDIRQTAKQIGNSIKEIFDSGAGNQTDSKLQSILAKMAQLEAESERVRTQISELTHEVATAEYRQLQQQLFKVTKEADGLRESMAQLVVLLREQGLSDAEIFNRESLKRGNADLIAFENTIAELQAKMQQLRDTGQATEIVPYAGHEAEVAKLYQQLFNLNNQLTIQQTKYREATARANELDDAQKRLATSSGDVAKNISQTGSSDILFSLDSLKEKFSGLQNAHKRFERGLKRGIRTFIKYAFGVRSVFFLYRKLRAAVMQGFGNLQKYSEPLGQSIKDLKNALNQLKNQFAAAFSPIVTAVLPYIQTFINALNAAISKVGQFIAALMGKKTWTRAKLVNIADDMNSAANATSGANEAAQEYKKTLMGFDDVNILQEPDKGSGSGGGAGGVNQIDPKDMFEEVAIESGIIGVADALRAMAEQGDWEGIGQTIADKLKTTLESIPWDTIYEKAAKFGTNLADFLNGLIDPELFYDVGATVAGALNTAIIFALEFGKEFDAIEFGNALAQAINGFFQKFDFKKLGQAIGVWVKNFTDTIRSFLMNIDWGSVFSAIGEFFEGLGVDGVLNILGLVAMTKFFGMIKTLFKDKISAAMKAGAKGATEGKLDLGTISTAVTIGLAIFWLIDQYADPAVDELSTKIFNDMIADQIGADKMSKDTMIEVRRELGLSLNFADFTDRLLRFIDGEGWYTDAEIIAQSTAKRLMFLSIASAFDSETTTYLMERMYALLDAFLWMTQSTLQGIPSGIKSSIESWFGVDVDQAIEDINTIRQTFKDSQDDVVNYYANSSGKSMTELTKQVAQEMVDSGYEVSDTLQALMDQDWEMAQRNALKGGQQVSKITMNKIIAGLNSGKGKLENVFTEFSRTSVTSMMGAGKYGSWEGVGSKIVNNIASGHLRAQAIAAGGITAIIETEQGLLYEFANGTYAYGEQVVNGVAVGIKNTEDTVKTSTNNLLNVIKGTALKGMEIASPSKWMAREVGSNITLGIAEGITGKQGSANSAISKIGTGLQTTVKNLKLYDAFKTLGINVVQGLIDGMSAKDKIATQKIANVVNNVKNKGKSVAVVSSPSKWFRDVIGQNITLGLALGIEDEEQKAVNAMERVSMAINRAGAASLPGIVSGHAIPYRSLTSSAVSSAANDYNKPVTKGDLEDILTKVVSKYMNIDFYIGDEQISRHADAGKQKINKKYSPVMA